MFCHQCGAKAHGAYCSHCGMKIMPAEGEPQPLPQVHDADDDGWVNEVRYELLLKHSNVRIAIEKHASQCRKCMSAEDFLGLCDKAFSPIPGVSLTKLAAIAQPLFADLGVKTGKTRTESFKAPPGKIIVAVLCSLARHGQTLHNVEQAEDGCLFRASLPSDLWSFKGELLVTVQRQVPSTLVEAATIIRGQLYDWGKSKRAMDALLEDIHHF